MAHVALVTGAAGGLGAEVAGALHRHGFHVALADIDGPAATQAANALDKSGESAFSLALDVRNAAGFEAALTQLCARWGAVHALVNNAAITLATPLLDISAEEYDAVQAVNARGTFLGSQVFGRYFKANGYGRIVNIASLAGQNGGTATGGHYAASKGAILTLTKVFARELAAHGVTVNAVTPGPLDLPLVRRIVPPEQLDALIGNIPVRQLGDPAFVADIVARLCESDSSFVTGASWDLNGGLWMR